MTDIEQIKELRADNERLTDVLKEVTEAWEAAAAEIERWKYHEGLAIERCKELEAENERLRDDYSILKRDYDALRAANEHLRTILGYLADNIDNPALVAVAEAALEPKP